MFRPHVRRLISDFPEDWDDADEESCSSESEDGKDNESDQFGVIQSTEKSTNIEVFTHPHRIDCDPDGPCMELRDIVTEQGVEQLFPPLDGTAFFSQICHMNVRNPLIAN